MNYSASGVIENLTDPTVLVATLTGFFGLASLLIGGGRWAKGRLDQIQEHTAEAREQVKNSHDTNLRDDIDRVLAALRENKDTNQRQENALSGMRTDLMVERTERIALSGRLDGLLMFKSQVQPQMQQIPQLPQQHEHTHIESKEPE